jgi:ABC-2 type transport system permease protein
MVSSLIDALVGLPARPTPRSRRWSPGRSSPTWLVGVGVAALVRNQVAALVGVAVWVLVVEGLLMSLLNAPSSLAKWLPSAAAAALTNPGGGHLSRLAGSLLLAGYALALALAGTRPVVRRDIT